MAVALSEERSRIARELHDVVAHCVSVMVVQAGASEALFEQSPDRARASLREVQQTGQQAISELTRMLGLLRGGTVDERDQLEPQPGAAQLPDLVERLVGSGLDARLEIIGVPRPLPPGVDLTVFRLAQEALTNTLKHAGLGAKARIELRYRPRLVELEVTDDGAGTGTGTGLAEGRRGHGLIGMAERVSIFDGSFEAGSRPQAGYRVHAVLPAEQP
jgi:signal transduction histidine kinase